MPSFDDPFDYQYGGYATPSVPEWRKCITSSQDVAEELSAGDEKGLGRLAVLPPELRNQILSYLHTKPDLAHVCASSKVLFALMTPLLYHSVHFIINTEFQPTLKKMLTRENPGLDYIREIKLSADFYNGNCGPAYEWIEIFVNAIPKDILKRFSWDTSRALLSRITQLLWRRQQKLEHVEIFSKYVDSYGNAATDEPDLVAYLGAHTMSTVSKMRFVPDTGDTALIGCAILKACPIVSLTVDARLWTEADAHQGDVAGEIHDPLTSCLFNHLSPASAGLPGTSDMMTSLSLSDENLRHARQTWSHLSKPKHLRLEHCANADFFINNLTARGKMPWLNSLTMVHDLGARSDRTIDYIEDLLVFPKRTLRVLSLCLRNAPRLPDVTALSLKQLGLHLPPASFRYKSFAESNTGFTRCLDIIIHSVCDITTLAILNWPDKYYTSSTSEYYASKVPQLARLAADVFARFHHYDWSVDGFVKADCGTMLEVVSFGVRERDANLPSPRYFVEAMIVARGRERRSAEKKKLSEFIDENLDITIINYEKREWDKHARTDFQMYQEYQDDGWEDQNDYDDWR
ncbi:hypothetical protein LTR85_000224 [Meristemomyces frigidus]|nr:hypothetical protein LTR85_000224 [Meristemomyces frigidus]